MIIKVIIFFLLCLIANVFARCGYYQSVAVWGRVLCDGRPQSNVKVKLYEKDKWFDDLLNKTQTNCNGVFKVRGSEYESRKMDIQVNIYHYCTKRHKVCPLKYKVKVPFKYIFRGPCPKQPYKLGNIRMKSWQQRWGHRDCFN